jgi:hypothetical protein
MRNFRAVFLALTIALPAVHAQQPPATPPAQVASVDPPSDQHLLLELQGDGVQIYACVLNNGAAGWKFQGPEAKLKSDKGTDAGTHFAGPSWKLLDGSEVKGSATGTKPASEPGAIPWLLLKVVSKTGAGKLSTAEYITRTNTKGGVAPTTGCDEGHEGQQARVPYSAKYSFYGK